MTVNDFDSVSKSTGTMPAPKAPEKVTFNGSKTFNLGHYDLRVTTQEDLTIGDKTAFNHEGVVIPKGTQYINDTAVVSAKSLSHYDDWAIGFRLSYPFAERFAKALQHAISLCGGKPESF